MLWSASALANCSIVVLPQSLLLWSNVLPTGEFPIISPGRVYEYTSCTTFSTTSGYMEGYYTFHCLYYKDKFFNVTIPRFHMVCPTFKVSTARMVSRDVVVLILDFFFPPSSCFPRTFGLILIGQCNCLETSMSHHFSVFILFLKITFLSEPFLKKNHHTLVCFSYNSVSMFFNTKSFG